MGAPGSARGRLARTLGTAYGDGLLSDATLAHRLDELFSSRLVAPLNVVGDISRRQQPSRLPVVRDTTRRAIARAREVLRRSEADAPLLLALDWYGGEEEILIGRHGSCDVVLLAPSVSRRHAKLLFRDGKWVLHDLDSRNGTLLNGERVGRCELRPGDVLAIGGQRIRLD